jgi:subtilisin family serine protease
VFSAREEVLAARRATGEARSGRELADLDLYFRVRVVPGTNAGEVENLVDDLNALATVEIAYAQPPATPPVDIPPPTPNFEGSQGYLDPAPLGIDARYSWTQSGGRGQGVRIVDVEGAWNTAHEDLPPLFYQGGVQTTIPGWLQHGTAVLGEMVAPNNGYGVTGIANLAQAGYESFQNQGPASAITNAAAAAGIGGIVLIEMQSSGPPTPSSPCNCSGTCCDCVPMEYFQAEFDAIAAATANGRIVVEAGANGATDLDDPVYGGRFDRAVRDSGAILVGASNAADRAPTCFTNFGSRIDVHAWGWDVTTTGYGTLFNGGGDPNQYYTSTFSGTSSASPIVTGAAANLQGVALAHGLGAETPADVRQRLRDTGTPQASDPRLIGPQPDLRAAIDQLLSCGPLNLELANQSISTTQTFEACDTIFAGPNLTIEPSGNVTLQAGKRVVLRSGFRVKLGAVFKAAIL